MNRVDILRALNKAFSLAVSAKLAEQPLPSIEEIADAADAAIAEEMARLSRQISREARGEARASPRAITHPDASALAGGPLAGQGDGNG